MTKEEASKVFITNNVYGCSCASYDFEDGYTCSVTGDHCIFLIPSSKLCAERYGEGPDA